MNGKNPPTGKGPPTPFGRKEPGPGGKQPAPQGEPTSGSEADKRRAARVRFAAGDNLEVRYKFLSKLAGFQSSRIFEGKILNLSKGGALFEGGVPGPDWLPKLGEGAILVGMNVIAPGYKPVKALASLRWTRASGVDRYELGVQFEQLEPEHRTNLDRFLISHQIKTRRFRRESFGQG